jgi:type II secretory pathway predicted ATPase ExeA
MYEEFYGLAAKPFSIIPDPDLIYWGPDHRLAFSMLEFGVLNSAGFTVITGEIGSGKTTLIRYLLRKLDPTLSVGLISNTPRDRDELLQWAMMSLGQPFNDPYPVLFQRFYHFLYEQYAKKRRTIIIIDEAQNLSADALEELRMLSNINADRQQFLQLILVGQPQLKQVLGTPRLVQFAQRVTSDFHLKPLSQPEVVRYIEFRLKAAGSSHGQLFTTEACRLIAHTSAGVPRIINILCDTALVYGYAANASRISAELVQMVIDDKRDFGVLPLINTATLTGPVLVDRAEK